MQALAGKSRSEKLDVSRPCGRVIVALFDLRARVFRRCAIDHQLKDLAFLFRPVQAAQRAE